jgi:3-methyladenine DNA glycosylase AlkC
MTGKTSCGLFLIFCIVAKKIESYYMPTPLKNYYTKPYLEHVATNLKELANVDARSFVDYLHNNDWQNLELKSRMRVLAKALDQHLDYSYLKNLEILKKLLPKLITNDFVYPEMLALFVPEYVILKGLDDFENSWEALKFFTMNGTSAEFAIRPFIIKHQEKTLEKMLELSKHKNPHARRFASEGARPRLPWGMALEALKKDPEPVLRILENLKSDDSIYVRKSVANNLNDISKDNPDIVLALADKWQSQNPHTGWILKRGLRTLLKKGDKEALGYFGVGALKLQNIKLDISSNKIVFGDSLKFNFEAELNEKLPVNLRLEYKIEFAKNAGKTSSKIFKISEGEVNSPKINVAKSHKFIDYTTRKHYPGEHKVTIVVNGVEVAEQLFELEMTLAI